MGENLEETWKTAAGHVLELFRTESPQAAFQYLDRLAADLGLAGQMGPPAGFREVAGQLYWQHKALPEAVAVSEEAIRRLEEALRGAEPVEETLIRPLGGTCYNLASFCWPGWDEPGITVGAEELKAGRRAADRCLALRLAPAHAGFRFGYSPSMAHWVVGAYQLADSHWPEAWRSFEDAARLNREDGGEDVLERGYGCLAALLEEPSSRDAQTAWEALLTHLEKREGDEHAGFFRQQLITAQRVFTC